MLIVACALMSISVYLILDNNFIKKFFGIVLLGSAINLLLFLSGQPAGKNPVFWIQGFDFSLTGNPLTQALILTAIVIGFAILVFLTTLLKILSKKQNDKL